MSAVKVKYGKPVPLLVDAKGFQDGRAVLFEIWKETGENKEKIDEIYGAVRREKGTGDWEPKFKREPKVPFKDKISPQPQKAQYSFTAIIDKGEKDEKSVQGTPIEFTYPLEIYVEDVNDKPLNGVKVAITLSDGRKKNDVLQNGRAKIEDAPAGTFSIEPEGYRFVKTGKIVKALWEKQEIKCEDKIKMIVDVEGFDDGTPAEFAVYEYSAKGDHYLVKSGINGKVNNNHVEVEWKFEYDKNPDYLNEIVDFEKDFTLPEFFFYVKIENRLFRCEGGLICCGGPLFVNEKGDPVEDAKALAYLTSGRIVACKIRNGYLTEPYLWKRGNVQVHIVDDIGGIT